jgi:hypothetical protein
VSDYEIKMQDAKCKMQRKNPAGFDRSNSYLLTANPELYFHLVIKGM